MLGHVARAGFALAVTALVVVSLSPAEELPVFALSDKINHFLAYAFVAALGGLGWIAQSRARIAIGVGLCGLGALLELVQAWVPGRMTDALDALANTVGTIAGLALVALARRVAAAAAKLGAAGR